MKVCWYWEILLGVGSGVGWCCVVVDGLLW